MRGRVCNDSSRRLATPFYPPSSQHKQTLPLLLPHQDVISGLKAYRPDSNDIEWLDCVFWWISLWVIWRQIVFHFSYCCDFYRFFRLPSLKITPANSPSPFHACARPPLNWPTAIRQSRHSFPKVEKWDEKHNCWLSVKYTNTLWLSYMLCVSVPHKPPAVVQRFSNREAPHKAGQQWAVKIHYIQLIFTQPAHQLNPIVSLRRRADRIFALHWEPDTQKLEEFCTLSLLKLTKIFFSPLLVNLFIAQDSESIF